MRKAEPSKKPRIGVLGARFAGLVAALRQLLDHDPVADMSRAQRLLARNLRVLLLVFRWEVYTKIKLHAQALTYTSLLSVVPLIAVVFAIFKGFGATEGIIDKVKLFLLANVSGSEEQQATLAEYIDGFAGNVNAGQLGWLSLLILVLSVLFLLGHIESSFNAVFGVTSKRPFVGRMLIYWSVLTFGPLLLALSFALTAGLQFETIEQRLEGLGAVWGATLAVLPLLATWIAFAVMYLVVPATRVKFSAAALAAVFTGSAWHGSKYLYSWYVKNNVTQGEIYGSLAAIPFFILWLYFSWLLVLFGAQLAYAFQNAETYRREDDPQDASQNFLERAACRLFLEVALDFTCNRPPPTPESLVNKLRIPRRILFQLVESLRRGDLVRITEPDGGLTPGRDLDEVTIESVLGQLRTSEEADPGLLGGKAQAFLDTLLAEVDRERVRVVGNLSFKALAKQLTEPTASASEGERQGDVH